MAAIELVAFVFSVTLWITLSNCSQVEDLYCPCVFPSPYKGMRKFQSKAIWCCDERKSRLGSLSPPSLSVAAGSLQSTEAVRCSHVSQISH